MSKPTWQERLDLTAYELEHGMPPEQIDSRTPADLRAALAEVESQRLRIASLEAALRSIAANTCCFRCQEAALVASDALSGGRHD